MAEQIIIETTGLTRRFGKMIAVAGLNLQVPRGAVYGFLGPNGAGKTTTIRMLLGLIRPAAGEVRLFGQSLAGNGRGLLNRVGALVETPSIYPHLTGRENLEVTRRLLRAPRDRIDRALTIVGLEAASGRRAGEYSQGMRQRLGLALALLGDPELLILDEPTNGLDPAGIREVRDLVRRLASESGKTVFLSSHLLSEVEQVATHLGIINQGQLLFQGEPSDLKRKVNRHLTLLAKPRVLAERLIVDGGWRLLPSDNGFFKVGVSSSADAAELNAHLNKAGVQVSHLCLEQPSLEDVFLNLTQGA